ncbi:hypothetical protein [Escherichia phage AnYang]|uniref:Uncharacterized protein n=1 Tax=Escherichia phage AnYang TaxID=2499909 RepID=A0A410T4L3_9CAUD|nr:hypothetical protein KNU29_gp014 [Escherichia phage AnYang]QAU03549.1 hypothetical protein [Escherichia phage AnYang]
MRSIVIRFIVVVNIFFQLSHFFTKLAIHFVLNFRINTAHTFPLVRTEDIFFNQILTYAVRCFTTSGIIKIFYRQFFTTDSFTHSYLSSLYPIRFLMYWTSLTSKSNLISFRRSARVRNVTRFQFLTGQQ